MEQTKHCYLYIKTKEQGNFPNIYHDEFGRIIYLTRKNENFKIAISGWEGNISKKATDSFKTHYEYSLNNCNSLFAYIRKNEDSITNYIYNARQYSILGWTMKIGSIFRLLWSTIFGRNISKYFLYIKAYLFFNYNQNNYTRINKEKIFITPNDLTTASNNYTNGITVRFVWRPFKKNFIGLYSQKTGREIKYVYETELEAARWNYRIVAERKVGIDCYPKTSPCTIYKTVADDFFETIDD
ncbi:hypothetical protein [Spiroplasma endosymbiont of Stenodema calcarata]|uniref:hypothetical protein n=1 Tax=Spiroplasma endosymbiont of Stenodema calcarata TaxID=3139328 RepID=UPI003CCB67A4